MDVLARNNVAVSDAGERAIVFAHGFGAGSSDLSACQPAKYDRLQGYSDDAAEITGNPERPELADGLGGSFCRTDPAIARQFARVTFLSDHRADLPRCAVPTLVLQTRADAIAPDEVGPYVAAHMPDAELVVMGATGHCPHMSAPAETIAAIRRYLG